MLFIILFLLLHQVMMVSSLVAAIPDGEPNNFIIEKIKSKIKHVIIDAAVVALIVLN